MSKNNKKPRVKLFLTMDAKLNEEFSFKISYIDKILPLIYEQSFMMFALVN